MRGCWPIVKDSTPAPAVSGPGCRESAGVSLAGQAGLTGDDPSRSFLETLRPCAARHSSLRVLRALLVLLHLVVWPACRERVPSRVRTHGARSSRKVVRIVQGPPIHREVDCRDEFFQDILHPAKLPGGHIEVIDHRRIECAASARVGFCQFINQASY